jgi:cell division protein FtsZ
MGSSVASGENRAKEAIMAALDSPLLNDNKITGAKNVLLLIVSGTNEITIDEIGEINDFIQAEAGHNANIIMGVGEEETLGESISVTIIATGFDIEQQHEIVNVEPKKIIHTLEDEQKSVHDLTKKMVPAFNYEQETPVSNSSERIVFELLEETVVEPAIVSINKEEMIVMSEFIKNLDVTFEIVSPINDLDFVVSSPEVTQIDVVEPKIFERQEQATFSFDLPLFKSSAIVNEPVAPKEENKIFFELTNETKDINVNEPVQFVPVTELTDKGIIRYSLEEFTEIDNVQVDSKPLITAVDEVIPEELNITMKQVDIASNLATSFESISPMDMTIEDTLKFRSEERRKKLKEFNYKFHNNISKIDELEKEPAYKRSGIELSKPQINSTNSRISVGTDSNDDLQLRSNNSYLHDNVD